MELILGIGGSIGGIVSGYIAPSVSNESLQYLLYLFLYFQYLGFFIHLLFNWMKTK